MHPCTQVMAPPGSAPTSTSAISAPLMDAIAQSFGSLDGLRANLTAAANGIFGSGWAWLVYKSDAHARNEQPLLVIATPNQDSPLMRVCTHASAQTVTFQILYNHGLCLGFCICRQRLRSPSCSAWAHALGWLPCSRMLTFSPPDLAYHTPDILIALVSSKLAATQVVHKELSLRPLIPIMGIDVWEHAYFLQ